MRNELKQRIKNVLRNSQGNYDGNIETLIDELTNEDVLLSLILEFMKSKYDITVKPTEYGDMLYYKGEQMFNLAGYSLLYNLTRICEELKEELR